MPFPLPDLGMPTINARLCGTSNASVTDQMYGRSMRSILTVAQPVGVTDYAQRSSPRNLVAWNHAPIQSLNAAYGGQGNRIRKTRLHGFSVTGKEWTIRALCAQIPDP